MQRRQFLASGSVLMLAGLAGCTGGLRYSLTEVIERLLTLSSQRAFARLMAPGGFYDSQIARISLPDRLSGKGSVAMALIGAALRDRLLQQVNRAAEKGAERAAPVVADAILAISPEAAAQIVRGKGAIATALLQQQMGSSLIPVMLPSVDEGLRLFDSAVVTQALRLATGIDFAGLRDDVTRKAVDAIFAEIGKEEIAIRADPRSTNDPVLIAGLSAANAM
ncbi:MAG: DUF4197 family protein [Sphingobium sp.]